MGVVTKRSNLDCNRESDMETTIRDTQEQLAHVLAYQEGGDPDLLRIKLEALQERQKEQQRSDHG